MFSGVRVKILLTDFSRQILTTKVDPRAVRENILIIQRKQKELT